jgi:hypothetical protein
MDKTHLFINTALQETPLATALFSQARRISWMSQECQSFPFSAGACIALEICEIMYVSYNPVHML